MKLEIISYLEKRIDDVEKAHDELIKPYYDEKLNIINVSLMSKKEKEEFVNKRNCLLVQQACYNEIIDFINNTEETGEDILKHIPYSN